MAGNYIQIGKTMTWTNSTGADVLSGSAVVVGALVGVALIDIPNGATGELATEEVWELPKTAAAIEQGAQVYLTPGKSITATEGGNTKAGVAFVSAVAEDATVRVKLNA
ncbi:DUF2190 family protein [Desulfovibrio gilichinskyi]|uniref:Predicted phage recombinase, RecA/RadA family n=1 Tax=Desulfovibrio gilichinskyi TaxID=1519643 RepID=A0A1X7CGZ0_9BACT|nr:capsid cement protein [Desulfovibrio gilichinskyi]SME96467.1 Predicted phage recombinase, RecA/RadA family [Desulfovibrio gilichinskyi]